MELQAFEENMYGHETVVNVWHFATTLPIWICTIKLQCILMWLGDFGIIIIPSYLHASELSQYRTNSSIWDVLHISFATYYNDLLHSNRG